MLKEEKSWYKVYEKLNIPKEINISDNENLLTLFEASFNEFAELPMYENMKKVFTYEEIDTMSKSIANFLMERFDQGTAIAIHMPNIIQMPVAIISILRAGMKVVPLNPLYTPYELEYILNDSNVECVFTLENFAYNLAAIAENVPSLRSVVVTTIGDVFGTMKKFFINNALKYIKKIVPDYDFEIRTWKWEKVISVGEKKVYIKPNISNEDIAFLQYTSGTTCKAKGVLLSHRNILANIRQIVPWTYCLKKGEESFLTPLPLYHSYALMLSFWTPIKLGAKNSLITNPKKIDLLVNSFGRNKTTALIAIEPLFKALLNNKLFCKTNFSNFKFGLAGGTSMDKTICDKWFNITGKQVVSGFGLTEASPCVCCNFVDGINFKHGTVGIPLPGTDVKFVDLESGKEVAEGNAGNMWIKGPQVAKAYLNNEEETKNNFVDGWLVTGDIAKMDKDGFISIVGRVKEMLNISGFNVSPYEIETVFNNHPKIKEAVAIKNVMNNGHDTVKLFVVKKDENLTEEELLNYGTKYLTNYKRPHIIEFVDTIPKSQLGKILRYLLK